MSRNKRMFYVWDENLDYYESLDNKSEFLNKAMLEARTGNAAQVAPSDELTANPEIEVPDDYPGHDHADPRMRALHRDIYIREQKNKRILAQSRGE